MAVGQQDVLRNGGLAQGSGNTGEPAASLVLHGRVFEVSLDPESVRELRQWVVKAASGQNCPAGFRFPAVHQVLSNA